MKLRSARTGSITAALTFATLLFACAHSKPKPDHLPPPRAPAPLQAKPVEKKCPPMPMGAIRPWDFAYAPNGYMVRLEDIVHARDIRGLPSGHPLFREYPRGTAFFTVFDDRKQPWDGDRSPVEGMPSYVRVISVHGNDGVELIVAVRNLCAYGPMDQRWAEFEIGLIIKKE